MAIVRICIGTSCYLKGAYNVLQLFQHEIEERGLHDKIEISGSFCMGQCQNDVSVDVDGTVYNVSQETAYKFFEETIIPRL
ncbi:MAG: (2Fe-2S) ferredoxin domain-containing protein [Synergistaceae bacterium]|nr:(2Fe-2S) ferredoxin domain-containing protein [Synergistaceae bacterium]